MTREKTPATALAVVRLESARIATVLHRQREVITITREDSRIARAIAWLLDTQEASGAWNNDNIAATAIVVLALAELSEPVAKWQIASDVKESCDRAATFLCDQYFGTRFEHTIWDTSMTVRALCASGRSRSDVVERQIAWLKDLDITEMRARPHHLAQRVLAFLAAGAPASAVLDAANEIVDLLTSDSGRHSPYVLGQTAEALRATNVTAPLAALNDDLLDFLSNASVDSANFVNICAAVRGLSPPDTAAIAENVRTNVASLFGDTCFRADGTWYHDPTATAWALRALTPFSREIVIRAPKAELMHEVNHVLDQMDRNGADADRHDMRKALAATVAAGAAGVIAGVYVTYSSLATVDTWIDWVAPTTFVVLSGYALGYFRSRLRGRDT